ncbi:MAG TPA: BREX-2 system adenine-specific DNA-methyltransferase PglX, partial [Polyangiales bacterium]
PVRVATGDSLRFGVAGGQMVLETVTEQALIGRPGEGAFVYSYEDAAELQLVLEVRYHAVVGNPPYITVKDPVLNGLYRTLWSACAGKYALSVPFVQRFFDLAVDGGYVGQITANSFMKREFGRKLILEYLPTQDLSLIVDTSGAYIPGHGTPTVLLFGRHREPVSTTVRAVLGIRGEPSAPADPATGLVWRSIVDHVDERGAQTAYVTVTDWPRETVSTYPWSLSGGGASDLRKDIDAGRMRLIDVAESVGICAVLGEEDAYDLPTYARAATHKVVDGEAVRDFSLHGRRRYWPYDFDLIVRKDAGREPLMWPSRTVVANYLMFGQTKLQRKLHWTEYGMFHRRRVAADKLIGYAEVATHNHFVLDRRGKVFNRTAPVIKLPDGASEDEHLQLLGLLNSSTACFWLMQVSHNKGEGGGARVQAGYAAMGSESWKNAYQFNSTKVSQLPLPKGSPLELARRLDAFAQELGTVSPVGVCGSGVPTRQRLNEARDRWDAIRADMISAQEELDWEVYGLYGLLDNSADDVIGHDVPKPPLHLGERAFEIALGRQMAAGEVESQWFTRHGSTPITEIPAHWLADYRALVQQRLNTIESDPYLHLIERPECKRRWATKPWAEQETEALRTWLCDRLEARALWFGADGAPRLRTVSQLADELRTDADFGSVAAL